MKSIQSFEAKSTKRKKIKQFFITSSIFLFQVLSFEVSANSSPKGNKVFPSEEVIKDSIVLIKLGEFQEAIFELEDKRQSLVKNPALYFYLGKAYDGLKNNQQAISYYQKAIELDPKYPKPYIAMALIKGQQKKMNEALEFLNLSIENNPNYAETYANRGVVKGALGDPGGAQNDFTKSIELNPLLLDAYINRGISYELTGNLSEACFDWEKARNLGSEEAKSWFNNQCKDNSELKLVRQLRMIKSLENKNNILEEKLNGLLVGIDDLMQGKNERKLTSQLARLENLEEKNDDLEKDISNLNSRLSSNLNKALDKSETEFAKQLTLIKDIQKNNDNFDKEQDNNERRISNQLRLIKSL
mgnify:CR=1 FL=1